MSIKVIAFDADDTLWVNEPYFRETEELFCEMFQNFQPQHTVARELLKTEIENLTLYGYGIKGFMLSMIETAMKISDKKISVDVIERLIETGKALLQKPVVIIDGVDEVLSELKGKYRLVMATKGDLLDQERKLKKSGLEHYFHHIEIMSDKRIADYQKLIKRLDITPDEFLMIGNSLKSDALPVLDSGGHAIHVPFHITWEHEVVESDIKHENFRQAETIRDVLKLV